jgi:hypothetical protein
MKLLLSFLVLVINWYSNSVGVNLTCTVRVRNIEIFPCVVRPMKMMHLTATVQCKPVRLFFYCNIITLIFIRSLFCFINSQNFHCFTSII